MTPYFFLPSTYFSYGHIQEYLKKDNPEYKARSKIIMSFFEEAQSQVKNMSDEEIRSKLKPSSKHHVNLPKEIIERSNFLKNSDRHDLEAQIFRESIATLPEPYPSEFIYPSSALTILLSLLFSITSSTILFFILKSATRITRWIVDGFR